MSVSSALRSALQGFALSIVMLAAGPPLLAAEGSRVQRDRHDPASLITPLDQILRAQGKLPYPDHYPIRPPDTWRLALFQAGNCLEAQSETSGQERSNAPPPVQAPTTGAGTPPAAGTAGTAGSSGGGDRDPNRYHCPRLPADGAPSLRRLAFQVILERTLQLTFSLEDTAPALAWPVRTLLRQWAEHIDRFQARVGEDAFITRLDEQGRALVAVHEHLARIDAMLRQDRVHDSTLSAATANALAALMGQMRRGFAPDGISRLAEQTHALRALLANRTAVPPSAQAVRTRNQAWSRLIAMQLRHMQPEGRDVARDLHACMTRHLDEAGAEQTAALARLAHAAARAMQVNVLLDDLGLSPGSILLFMRPRIGADTLRRALQTRTQRFDYCIGEQSGFMQKTAAIDPRGNTNVLANVLARAMLEENARSIQPVPALTSMGARDNLFRLVLDAGPDGAIEMVRSILSLRAQLRIGLTLVQRPEQPAGAMAAATLAVRTLADRLQPLGCTDDLYGDYRRTRDALYVAVRILERSYLPTAHQDLEQIRQLLRGQPGQDSPQQRNLQQIVWPALRMIRENLTLRDTSSIQRIRTLLSTHAERLQHPGQRFFNDFTEFLLNTDYSQPPRFWSYQLIDRSHLVLLAYNLEHWSTGHAPLPTTPPPPPAAPPPAGPAPGPAPGPSQPRPHDEL